MGARPCQVFCRSWGHCQKWPCGCGAEGFCVFFRFFFDPVFADFKCSSSHPPFLFRCFCLWFAFFLGLGATPHCTCVFGHLAFKPSYSFVSFCLFTRTLFFSLRQGFFWFISLVTQHCDPPYRAIGYSYTDRIYVFRYRRVSREPPPFWGYRKIMLRGASWGGVGGYRRSMLPSPL